MINFHPEIPCIVVLFFLPFLRPLPAPSAEANRLDRWTLFDSDSSVRWPATASRRSPEFPATSTLTTRARRRAASGSRPTADSLDADFRQPAGDGDRRAGGRAVGPQHRVGRHRRSVGDSRQRRHRRRHLQVDGRGKTWVHMGLDETGRIGRIVVHPTNPDIVFACALGRITGPQQERGVYRTTDGGQHWERVLFVDENTGCSGLSMDAQESATCCSPARGRSRCTPGRAQRRPRQRRLRVARRRHEVDDDRSAAGLPQVAARQDRRRGRADRLQPRLRADSDHGSGLGVALRRRRRELAGGELGSRADRPRRLLHPSRGLAGERERECSSPTARLPVRSTAARRSGRVQLGRRQSRHLVGSDESRSLRRSRTTAGITHHHAARPRHSIACTLPIGQMYHVTVDNQVPYYVYTQHAGRRHDARLDHAAAGRAAAATDARRSPAGITAWAAASPASRCPIRPIRTSSGPRATATKVTRWDARTKLARSVSPWLHTLDSPPNDTKYRCHWTAPLAIDPFDHNTVYYGCQVIFQTPTRRPELARDQPRSVDAGSDTHRFVGRNRRRQSRAVLRRGGLRDRAVRRAEGADLGRHQRRQDLVHERRRRDTGTT